MIILKHDIHQIEVTYGILESSSLYLYSVFTHLYL